MTSTIAAGILSQTTNRISAREQLQVLRDTVPRQGPPFGEKGPEMMTFFPPERKEDYYIILLRGTENNKNRLFILT